ncbi:DUF397 domain-containing protein [Streptomyces albipurpureus]|uniref:DUF397 domain-containing protein n=1 Tax=Streptomyces albipurpureus TaxID=2897419 RepID=A0ABT0UN94_9ACTN|nr:DUF397 domain-containing protein [Streptomyces sp. CWNU-1]MCM2390087.1 DUF397 domain-containing protein [Streptomyces sp. CWNU-1]
MKEKDPASTQWRKSSYSGPDGGQCVEWAPAYASIQDFIPVRDSKAIDGPTVVVSLPAWASFVSAVRGGQFPKA